MSFLLQISTKNNYSSSISRPNSQKNTFYTLIPKSLNLYNSNIFFTQTTLSITRRSYTKYTQYLVYTSSLISKKVFFYLKKCIIYIMVFVIFLYLYQKMFIIDVYYFFFDIFRPTSPLTSHHNLVYLWISPTHLELAFLISHYTKFLHCSVYHNPRKLFIMPHYQRY